DDESIAVHEFCHTIDAALRRLDAAWRERLRHTYRRAQAKGLSKKSDAQTNHGGYWAELRPSYFASKRVHNWDHARIGTRQQLNLNDPDGYEWVRPVFKLTGANDWRYRPLRVQPSVTPPPAAFKIDPYYTKFTYAREFTVLGSKHAGDEALLKANHTIRKMF